MPQTQTQPTVEYVPLSVLKPGNNPYGSTRISNVQDILAGLKTTDDIRQLPPIDIDQEGRVLAGERRFEAITKFAERINDFEVLVPVLYRNPQSLKEEIDIALNENERRKQATVVELAYAYAAARKAGFTNREACSKFLTSSGKPQQDGWGSQMSLIHEACELSPLFRKVLIKYEIWSRDAYELAKSCYAKSEDLGKVQELLDKAAIRLKERSETLKGQGTEEESGESSNSSESSGSANPSNEPPQTKPLTAKKVLLFVEDAELLLKERVSAAKKDTYIGPRIEPSDVAAVNAVLKYIKLIIGGSLTVEQLLKKFHVEGYKEPKEPKGSKATSTAEVIGEPAESEEKPAKKKKAKKSAPTEEVLDPSGSGSGSEKKPSKKKKPAKKKVDSQASE